MQTELTVDDLDLAALNREILKAEEARLAEEQKDVDKAALKQARAHLQQCVTALAYAERELKTANDTVTQIRTDRAKLRGLLEQVGELRPAIPSSRAFLGGSTGQTRMQIHCLRTDVLNAIGVSLGLLDKHEHDLTSEELDERQRPIGVGVGLDDKVAGYRAAVKSALARVKELEAKVKG